MVDFVEGCHGIGGIIMSEEIKVELTDEQQAYVDLLVVERTSGLFTKEDLEREVTREVDRRVQSGIQKGIETQKSKWKEEFEKQSKLTAEELAEEQLKAKLGELESREKELALRANTLDAKSMLANAEIPKEHYEKFVGILVDGDEEKTRLNVQNFIDTFNETKTNIEKGLQEKYSIIPSPNSSDKSKDGLTKEQFSNMSYMERKELKEKDENLYNKLIK